jgi:hypothetical protein
MTPEEKAIAKKEASKKKQGDPSALDQITQEGGAMKDREQAKAAKKAAQEKYDGDCERRWTVECAWRKDKELSTKRPRSAQ